MHRFRDIKRGRGTQPAVLNKLFVSPTAWSGGHVSPGLLE